MNKFMEEGRFMPNLSPEMQGFLTSDGKFVNRIKAREIAIKAKQKVQGSSDAAYSGRPLKSTDLFQDTLYAK
jgi:hypothetical protein